MTREETPSETVTKVAARLDKELPPPNPLEVKMGRFELRFYDGSLVTVLGSVPGTMVGDGEFEVMFKVKRQ